MLKLKKSPNTGKLIVFEGTDGAGKTALIEMTSKYLADKYGEKNIVVLKQPTDLSRKTRLFQKMMYSETHNEIDYRAVQLLTMSDRIQHGYEVIEPTLKKGKIIICDRYIYTSLANMLARGYRKERWFYHVAKHVLKPDIVFLASVPPELAIKRIKNRPEECNRYLDETLLRNVSEEFLKLAKRDHMIVLDTSSCAEMPFRQIKILLQKEGL